MSFNSFIDYFVTAFLQLYTFTDSIYPFKDVPGLSLFWLFDSLILTSIAWQLFPDPVSSDFSDSDE